MKSAPSYTIRIYIAGDYADAIRAAREFCEEGACFAIQATDYVYTGGTEAGVIATIINYPRFPSESSEMLEKATRLAEHLRARLFQDSFSIETPTETFWFTRRDSQ